MTEEQLDKQLNIDTCGIDKRCEDNEHHAYEPTPYDVLDLLIDSGYLGAEDHVVDMGAGKGRVCIYMADQLGCQAMGIEYNTDIYNQALENLKNMKSDAQVDFCNQNAEKYEFSGEETAVFFFNPFTEKILESVLANVERSYCDKQRDIKLIFYYPSLEFVGRLMTKDYLEFVDEIDCSHLYKDNKGRECIMIFRII